jgi:hypothetical protein
MNKTFFIVSVLLLLTVGAKAQTVTADIRITEEGFPIIFGVAVTCDGLDSVFSVEPDSTGHFRMVVPRGRCVISALMLDDVCLDLQSDTSIALDLIVTPWPMHRDGYRSRREKDSALHAREALLKADLYGMDTNRWPYQPNYATLAQMMEDDLFYRLPRWRTYNMDTVLYYLKFCYFCDRNEYDYLYYTIRQMEHRMGLEPDLRVKPPRKPDGRWYCPMPEVPENWMDDTATDYGDLIAHAREWSKGRALSLEPMGEKSLVYPKRKGLAFRMVMDGGLCSPTSVRVEKGRFYYRCREYTWDGEPPKSVDEALDFALTKAELDTMARCIAALDTLTTNLVGDWPGIDGPTFEFEWVKDGNYRSVICYHPGKEEPIKTLFDYLIRLRMRHLCKVSFYLEDEFPGHKYFSAESYTRGRRWLSFREAHRWKGEPTTHYVPKGKYTLSVEKPGYETIERKVDVKGDVMLDTLRMRHKRITLRLQLQTESGWPLTGPIGMYFDGVDSAIVGDFDPIGQTVVFHDVPAACDYYLVEHVGRSGGWYHSQVDFIRDWKTTDTLTMRLDRSREYFSSRSRKDIHLNGIVRNRRLSGGNHDLELGELYYYDALLEDIPTWQSFPKADSLAYDCLRRVYHSDPQQYGYLYYPIQHLVWKNWDLKNDSTIRKPEVDSTCYVPLPEELWEKKHYDDYDLLTPFREAQEESDSYRRHLATMQEPSLVFPQRVRPSFRWIGFSPVSGSTEIVRIDGDTLYVKEMFNTRDLYDAADISQEWPDTVVVRKQVLSAADQEALRRRLEVLAAEGYKGMVGPGPMPGCTDRGTAVFEYVLEGRYHRFEALYPDKMAAVKALMDWIEELKKEE